MPSDRAAVSSARWRSETAGFLRKLRDEVVELYREERVKIDQVNWLIGYMVLDIRKRWRSGTRWEYRERYRTSRATKAWCSFSFVIVAAKLSRGGWMK